MAQKVVDTIEPNGNFAVVDTVNVSHNGSNLKEYLEGIANTDDREVYDGTFEDLQADSSVQENVLYWVTTSSEHVYNQYTKINGTWYYVGTTEANLSNVYTKQQIDARLAQKQNALTAGNNIIIEGNVISAVGVSPFADVHFEIDMSTGELNMIPNDGESEIDQNMAFLDADGYLCVNM